MITGLYAGILTLLYIYLSFRIIKIRGDQKVSLGNGNFLPLETAIRVHGNFSEYIPLGLLLLALLELNGTSPWIIYILGSTLTLGRILHISAFLDPEKHILARRVAGMMLTFSTLSISGAFLIIQFMMSP